MTKRIITILFTLAFAPVSQADTYAITGGIVHTVGDAGLINGGTVIIRDGKIIAVGADVTVPRDAKVIDAAGKVVTPGFMDANSALGVEEISLEDGTMDGGVDGEHFSAAFSVADAINPRSTLITTNRIEGLTRAAVAPWTTSSVFSEPTGSVITGQSAVINLGSVENYVDRSSAAMHVVLGEEGAQHAGGSRAAALLRLREALDDTRDYASNRRAWEQGNRRDYQLHRLDLEALQAVLGRDIPLVAEVYRASDIEAALRLAADYRIRLVLLGAREAWMVAGKLAAANVPVIINTLDNVPRDFQSLGSTLQNAAALHAAGVKIAFTVGDSHNPRNIKQNAGNAVAYGLPWTIALEALTVNPAEIFGVANYGRLEPGMDADVVVWDGDPLEVTTFADHVFIKGREIPMVSRQTLLRDRYMQLDTPRPPAYHD